MQNDIKKIKEFLKGSGIDVGELKKMSGDASSRRYYLNNKSNSSEVVCIDRKGSQQISDYIELNKKLNNRVRTPKVLHCKDDYEICILENIGDITLNFYLSKNRTDIMRHLEKAIEDIIEYQKLDIEELKLKNLFFDREKIEFEMGLSKKFFLENYLGLELEKEWDDFKDSMLTIFEENKTVFCHRDYHGRNLFVKEDEIIHIDFQDARVGPQTYDLASILEDSYFYKTKEEREALKKLFYKKNGCYDNEDDFNKEYDLVAIERIMKALGSFTYLKEEKELTRYERYIGVAIELLLERMDSCNSFGKLREKIAWKYYGC